MNTKKYSQLKLLISLSFLYFISISTYAQSQNINGIVYDKSSQEPLIGAHVLLLGDEEKGTISDQNGRFTLSDVPLGRVRIQCNYIGYESFVSASFVINSAKEPYLEIGLEESYFATQEVVIQAKSFERKAENEMVLLNGRSFSVEETERYAGSIADPSRMAVGFAGVQSSNDLDNDIIVRGNSSVGVLWRLEGIDIPNPNHFARRGSSGGGIGIFSVNMISNSDFIFGTLPAEYGNTISSVFDMKFRKGNKEKQEFSLRAGILGLDLVAEGPINQNQSSFLINYRYSTLGLLNKAGIHLVDENTDNTFSDLAFHLNFPTKNNKNIIQLWGIGGISSEIHNPVPQISEWKEFDDLTHTDFKTRMGVTGLTYTHLINDKSYLKFRSALMGDHIIHNKDTVDFEFSRGFILEEEYSTSRWSNTFEYVQKISPSVQYEIGSKLHFISYDLIYNELDRVNNSLNQYLDDKSSIFGNILVQSYVQGTWKPGYKIKLYAGLHYLNWSFNNSQIFDPRVSLSFYIDSKSTLGLAYGLQSQILPLGTYLTHNINLDLDFLRSSQWTMSYSHLFGDSHKLTSELYYQKLTKIPVAADPAHHYWMLNDLVGYSKYALSSDGGGRNYGLDITLEKFFDAGFFYMFCGSIYRSEYTINGSDYFRSRYDGSFNTSIMIGKEHEYKNGNSLQFGIRNLWFGGQRYSLNDETITDEIREYFEDRNSPLTEQNKNYWRSDIRIAYRKNLPSYSWILSLDVQNIMNIENTRGRIWNFNEQVTEDKLQAGIVPVINFQIDF